VKAINEVSGSKNTFLTVLKKSIETVLSEDLDETTLRNAVVKAINEV